MAGEVGAKRGELLAAIDLGSNSFHMIIGRLDGGQLKVVDRIRERVQLGAGLDERRRLTAAAQARALGCLERFGQRVRGMELDHVRAVGTNTLRQAKNSGEFLDKALLALGHPIEIIAGREEARLIYLGALQTMPSSAVHRLVVDIGGGSTECIVGERQEILEADSLYMGCVSWSLRYFGDGRITEERLATAELAAQLELQPIARRYRRLGWDVAIGCSGTVLAIERIARLNGWSSSGITPRALKKLKKELVAAGTVSRLSLEGLSEERAGVLAGGAAILSAIFEALRIEQMEPSPGALREGTLYDLVGRIRHEDVRDRTIRWFASHYHVDVEQAARVERTALFLLEEVRRAWGLEPEAARRYLTWASHLHELGLSISHTGYHKHSAYLVEHADMAGFSRDDQRILAAMILGHRRKLRPQYFERLPASERELSVRLTVLLRLAVCLQRSRSDELWLGLGDGARPRGALAGPPLTLEARKRVLVMRFPRGWLEAHPLTAADLEQQAEDLARMGFELHFGRPRAPRRVSAPRKKKRAAR